MLPQYHVAMVVRNGEEGKAADEQQKKGAYVEVRREEQLLESKKEEASQSKNAFHWESAHSQMLQNFSTAHRKFTFSVMLDR